MSLATRSGARARITSLFVATCLFATVASGAVAGANTAAASAAPSASPSPGRSLGFGLRVPVYDTLPTSAQFKRGAARPRQVAPHTVPSRQANVTASAVSAPLTVTGPHATFVVTLTDFTPDAQTAFLAAVQTWADQMYSPVPITVDAAWTDLSAFGAGILGAAGPDDILINTPNAPSNVGYPIALANAIAGQDLEPSYPDIDANFNSAYANWSFAAGGPSQTTEDFQSVVTHELGHGLGFISSFAANGDCMQIDQNGACTQQCPVGTGCFGPDPSTPTPMVFDQFAYTGATGGTQLISMPDGSATLYAAETSDNVYWHGQWGIAQNSGTSPKLYFPLNDWQPGSSGAHLDFQTFSGGPNGLMVPALVKGTTARSLGTVTPGIMLDLGWSHQLPDEAFVRALFPDFLGRAATHDDVALGVAVLGQKPDRYQFALALSKSTEWVTNIVLGFYANTLSRPPDQGGVDYWVNAIQTGQQTVASTAANFYASPEYYAGKGGGTDKSWVDNLYSVLLNRGPDGGGETYWIARTAEVGRGLVALDFYQSDESRRVRVTNLYQSLLSRGPDPAGLTYWAGRVLSEGDLSLAANLAGSAEYLGRAENKYLFTASI